MVAVAPATGESDGGAVTASLEEDEAQLRALQQHYAEAFDGGRPDDFAALFTADGTLVRPDGTAVNGQEALTAFAAAAAARPARTHHFMRNHVFRVEGDLAHGAAHVCAVSRDGDSLRLLIIGRSEDTMTRTPMGWRIAVRRIHELEPVEPA